VSIDSKGGPLTYIPSGRVAWGQFAPLALAGFIVAAAMAVVLSLLVRRASFFLGGVLAYGIPVLLAIVLCVYVGRCRNRTIAWTVAAGLSATYYLGAWAIACYRDVFLLPGGTTLVSQLTGLPPVLGYVVLRNDPSSGLMMRPMLTAALLGLHVLEFALFLGAALYAARWFVGRAFYESHGRWATSWTFGFERQHLDTVQSAVRDFDWSILERIEKLSLTRETRRRGAIIFRIEYLPRGGDQQVYVTIEGPRFRMLHRFTRKWLAQIEVPPAQASELARRLPGFEIASPDDATPLDTRTLNYCSDTAGASGAAPGGMVSALREAGFVPVTLVGKGKDFRDPAAHASSVLTLGAPTVDIEAIDASLCLVADPSPVRKLKLFSWIETGLLLSFVLFSAIGFVLSNVATAVSAGGSTGTEGVALWAASSICIALSIASAIVVGVGLGPLQRVLLTHHFRRRGSSILSPHSLSRREIIRIEDPATFHIGKLVCEDFGIAIFDHARGRLLIEGVSHRYVIRGGDVTSILPLKSNQSTVQINYRIGETDFGIVVNRYRAVVFWLSALAAMPLLGLPVRSFSRRAPDKFAQYLRQVLRCE
jgi:hypothetical protein